MSRHRFAVVGTNTGHYSTTGGVSWIPGPHMEDTLEDWVSRSTHISKLLSEEVIDAFYGKVSGVRVKNPEERNPDINVSDNVAATETADNKIGRKLRTYFAGCSVGGRAGLSSQQNYPDDFDGLFIGSPAYRFGSGMNFGQIHTQKTFRAKAAGDGYFAIAKYWSAIHDTVLKACDEQSDGIKDGVIGGEDFTCQPDWDGDLLCNSTVAGSLFGADPDSCLNTTQIANLKEAFKPTVFNGTQVYSQYLPGAERQAQSLTGLAAKAIGYTQVAILGLAAANASFDGFKKFGLVEAQLAEKLDPAQNDARNTDLTPFLSNPKRKAILVHGLSDFTISPLETQAYYDKVGSDSKPANGHSLQDSFRFFKVPGMLHCRDGDGAWNGAVGVTQNDPGNRPLEFTTEYDMLLRLVAWTERNLAPEYHATAAYGLLGGVLPTNPDDPPAATIAQVPTWLSSYDYGVRFTRRLCPYPKVSKHVDGPTDGPDAYKSFDCVDP